MEDSDSDSSDNDDDNDDDDEVIDEEEDEQQTTQIEVQSCSAPDNGDNRENSRIIFQISACNHM